MSRTCNCRTPVDHIAAQNLASQSFLARARAALERAIPRLYGSVARPALSLTLLVVALALVTTRLKGGLLPRLTMAEQGIWLALSALTIWSLVEMFLQLRLQKRLGQALAVRVARLRARQQRMHRWLLRFAVVGGWFLLIFATG